MMETQPAAPTDQPITPAARPPKERESPLRLLAYVAGGALAIYLATWVGPAAFYVEFQKLLLARESGDAQTVLGREPSSVACAATTAWSRRDVDGVPVPLPPGRLLEIKSGDGVVTAKLEEGTVTIAVRKPGSIASLYQEKLAALSVKGQHGLDDAGALRAIAEEQLSRYEATLSEGERQRYAARLLAKMSLWELRPIRQLDLATGSAACAALVEHVEGDARLIVATEQATLFVTLSKEAPAAWKTAACWLP